MANIPYKPGYSTQRQWRVIDVLIMKNDDDFRVHRTIPITLKEADANDNTKRMAKYTSAVAEKYGLLAAENYGNQVFFSAIHVAAINTLSMIYLGK